MKESEPSACLRVWIRRAVRVSFYALLLIGTARGAELSRLPTTATASIKQNGVIAADELWQRITETCNQSLSRIQRDGQGSVRMQNVVSLRDVVNRMNGALAEPLAQVVERSGSWYVVCGSEFSWAINALLNPDEIRRSCIESLVLADSLKDDLASWRLVLCVWDAWRSPVLNDSDRIQRASVLDTALMNIVRLSKSGDLERVAIAILQGNTFARSEKPGWLRYMLVDGNPVTSQLRHLLTEMESALKVWPSIQFVPDYWSAMGHVRLVFIDSLRAEFLAGHGLAGPESPGARYLMRVFGSGELHSHAEALRCFRKSLLLYRIRDSKYSTLEYARSYRWGSVGSYEVTLGAMVKVYENQGDLHKAIECQVLIVETAIQKLCDRLSLCRALGDELRLDDMSAVDFDSIRDLEFRFQQVFYGYADLARLRLAANLEYDFFATYWDLEQLADQRERSLGAWLGTKEGVEGTEAVRHLLDHRDWRHKTWFDARPK